MAKRTPSACSLNELNLIQKPNASGSDAHTKAAKSDPFPTLQLLIKHHCAVSKTAATDHNATTHIDILNDVIYSFLLWKHFVLLIQENNQTCYRISKTGKVSVRSEALAQFLALGQQLLSINPCRGRHAMHCHDVEHAYQAACDCPARHQWWCETDPVRLDDTHSISQIKAFEKVIKAIRKSFRSRSYRRYQSKSDSEYKRQLQDYSDYVTHLFQPTKQRSERRRLLVIRVDLGFRKAILDRYQLDTFLDLLNTFFDQHHRNPLFQHLEGYIRKVEFGLEKGWHAHLLFFFNADHVLHSATKAQNIGLAWNELVETHSQGRLLGVFYNCHYHEKKYKHPCLGKFDNYDAIELNQKLNNLKKYLLPYLLKREGRIHFVHMPKQKLLTRSPLPAIIRQRLAANASALKP